MEKTHENAVIQFNLAVDSNLLSPVCSTLRMDDPDCQWSACQQQECRRHDCHVLSCLSGSSEFGPKIISYGPMLSLKTITIGVPSQHVPSICGSPSKLCEVQDPGLDLFRASAGQQGKHILKLPNRQSSQHPDHPVKTGENHPDFSMHWKPSTWEYCTIEVGY